MHTHFGLFCTEIDIMSTANVTLLGNKRKRTWGKKSITTSIVLKHWDPSFLNIFKEEIEFVINNIFLSSVLFCVLYLWTIKTLNCVQLEDNVRPSLTKPTVFPLSSIKLGCCTHPEDRAAVLFQCRRTHGPHLMAGLCLRWRLLLSASSLLRHTQVLQLSPPSPATPVHPLTTDNCRT